MAQRKRLKHIDVGKVKSLLNSLMIGDQDAHHKRGEKRLSRSPQLINMSHNIVV